MKKVSFGREAMESMMRGLDKVADAVSSTIGPKGRNAYIMHDLTPKITNDGVTIANKIILEDPEEDAGAYIIRNVSAQQNDDVGDGTTTVTILTQAIIHEALKRPENPMEIKESLQQSGQKLLKQLAKKSVKIKTTDINRVALISSENEQLALLITEIIGKLGSKAVMNVEDSKTFATDYEIVDGYEAGVGFMSPHFINDTKSGKASFEDVPIFVSERKIANVIDIQPLFEQLAAEKISQCVIVCEDIDDAMLGLLVMNKSMGRFNPLVIRCAGEIIEDIAGATGATICSNRTGLTFKDVTLKDLGRAKKVVSEVNKTLFIIDSVAPKQYAQELFGRMETEVNQYTKKHLEQRMNRVLGGIANLRIGAATDFEREYLKLKAEDAIKATKAAIEEGIVEGGGMALWRLCDSSQTVGAKIMNRALTTPLRKIIENAGKDYTDIVPNILDDKGYDAKNNIYVDMMKAGIIDPTKVERCALENAISAASTFITTYTCITEIKDVVTH